MRQVLVTGASEGIGRATALAFARQGWAVWAVARNEKRLATLLEEIQQVFPSPHHRSTIVDLSSNENVRVLLEMVQAQPPDCLVNNAGMGGFGNFSEQSWEAVDTILELNMRALTRLSHGYLKVAAPGSSLILVGSVLSYIPMAYHAVYAATKAYVQSLGEALWGEFRGRGIYVGTVCPGYTATQFTVRAGRDDSQGLSRFADSPESVAEVIVGLALGAVLEKGYRPTLVAGIHNQVLVLLATWMPERLRVFLATRFSKVFLGR